MVLSRAPSGQKVFKYLRLYIAMRLLAGTTTHRTEFRGDAGRLNR